MDAEVVKLAAHLFPPVSDESRQIQLPQWRRPARTGERSAIGRRLIDGQHLTDGLIRLVADSNVDPRQPDAAVLFTGEASASQEGMAIILNHQEEEPGNPGLVLEAHGVIGLGDLQTE